MTTNADTKQVGLEFSEAEPEPGPECVEITITRHVRISDALDVDLDSLPLGAIMTVTRRQRQKQQQQIVVRSSKPKRQQKTNGVPPRLLNKWQAGAYLGKSPKAVVKMAVDGQIPVVRGPSPGSTSPWLFDKADLDRWVEDAKERF